MREILVLLNSKAVKVQKLLDYGVYFQLVINLMEGCEDYNEDYGMTKFSRTDIQNT